MKALHVMHVTPGGMLKMIRSKNILIIIILLIPSLNLYAQDYATIQDISNDQIVINAGTEKGLVLGDILTASRNDEMISKLEITHISKNSATCRILENSTELRKGNQVRIDNPEKPKTKTISKTRYSGYLVFQHYQFNDISTYNNDFKQPAVRFKLKVKQLWDRDYNLNIKLRSRYNQRSRRYNSTTPETEWRNRLYEVSFSYDNPNSTLNYKVGRIISHIFSGLGYIDGLNLQYNTFKNLKLGAFAGTQPQWQYSSFQTSLQKYGTFINYNRGDFTGTKYEVTLAAAGEYHDSIVSREFVYLQSSINAYKGWYFYQRMELDINRDWRKEEKNQSTVSLSNLYLNASMNISEKLTAGLSYNNYKNYYTYELLSVADSLFDDAFRQGLRGNINFKWTKDTRIFGNYGLRKKSDENTTTSYSLGIYKNNLFIKRMRLSLRFSGFSNLYTRGVHPSVTLGKYLKNGHYISLGYGSYNYEYQTSGLKRNSQWLQFNTQIELPASFYITTNYEYEWGDVTFGHRIYTDLGYRF